MGEATIRLAAALQPAGRQAWPVAAVITRVEQAFRVAAARLVRAQIAPAPPGTRVLRRKAGKTRLPVVRLVVIRRGEPPRVVVLGRAAPSNRRVTGDWARAVRRPMIPACASK